MGGTGKEEFSKQLNLLKIFCYNNIIRKNILLYCCEQLRTWHKKSINQSTRQKLQSFLLVVDYDFCNIVSKIHYDFLWLTRPSECIWRREAGS